jgi:hypothetical protein
VYPPVTTPNTRPLWALGRADLARFGSSATAWRLSRSGGWAGRGGSPTPHPGTPRPSQGAPTRVQSSGRAAFFSRVVRIRTRDPVFRSFPIGLKPFEGPANGFITHQVLSHPLLIAHFSRQGQGPHPRGLAIETRRLRQEMLETVTARGIQHGLNGLRTMRLLRQALHAPRVKSMEDVTDSLHRTPHKLRNELRRQPAGTRQDDLGTPDTEGVRAAAVGFQLPTLVIGQGANKEWWFQSPSLPLEAQWHKNSCGDALADC